MSDTLTLSDLSDAMLYQTVQDAIAVLAEPADGSAFGALAAEKPLEASHLATLATVKALVESAPEFVVQVILSAAAIYAEEFAEQYQRAEAARPAV